MQSGFAAAPILVILKLLAVRPLRSGIAKNPFVSVKVEICISVHFATHFFNLYLHGKQVLLFKVYNQIMIPAVSNINYKTNEVPLERLTTMNSKRIAIDNRSLGSRMLLVEVRPTYDYANGQRSENVIGYTYVVSLPMHNLDKLSVKIAGKQLLDTPTDGYSEVEFTDLVVRPYVGHDGRLALTATATAVKIATTKS